MPNPIGLNVNHPLRDVRFRLALASADEAKAAESSAQRFGAGDVDVDPLGGLVDPLTLESVGACHLTASLDAVRLGQFLEDWWQQLGWRGLVVDLSGPIGIVTPSSAVDSQHVVVIDLQGRESTRFVGHLAEWIVAAAQRPASVEHLQDARRSGRLRELAEAESKARLLALEIGLDPDIAERQGGVRAAWVHKLWNALVDTIDATDRSAIARVRSATVRYEPRPSMAASTFWGSRYLVSVNLGMVEALVECSRAVVGEVYDPDVRGQVAARDAFEEVGIRISHVLGWLSSVAQYPVATPSHNLPPSGETHARALATGAMLFVLAHELGHVIADDGRGGLADPHSREYLADLKAFEILRKFASLGPPATDAATELAGIEMSMDLMAIGGAVYLSFEGLLRLVSATAEGNVRIPWPSDVVASTATPSHPSPFARLERLRGAAMKSDPDGSEVDGLNAVIEGFVSLRPVVERNMPEWVLTEDDAAEWLRVWNVGPGQTELLVGRTIHEIYSTDVLELLRVAGSRGTITSSELGYLSRSAGYNPRSVINTLAYALVKRVPTDDDPDAGRIHAMAAEVADRIEPAMLRYAVRAQPDVMSLLDSSAGWRPGSA